MEEVKVKSPQSFEEALLRGTTVGYVVCVKARRFARLPDSVAMSFAEIDGDNRYCVFECRADAEKRMEAMLPSEKLGSLFSIREIKVLPTMKANDGPQLDPSGQPFAMQAFIVDQAGVATEWSWGARLGWRGPIVPTASLEDGGAADLSEPRVSLLALIAAWFRTLGSR